MSSSSLKYDSNSKNKTQDLRNKNFNNKENINSQDYINIINGSLTNNIKQKEGYSNQTKLKRLLKEFGLQQYLRVYLILYNLKLLTI